MSNIKILAKIIKAKKERGEPFVVMLGAGASLNSGVLPTQKIKKRVVNEWGSDLTDKSVETAFMKLWDRESEERRTMFVEGFLKKRFEPSSGYEYLARLVREGYFDILMTFNYDDLIVEALRGEKLVAGKDFNVIKRGEHRDDRIEKLIDSKDFRIKVLKLHGSIRSTDDLLFSRKELSAYPQPVADVVKKLTQRDIIVCGYAFRDRCVQNAFSKSGGVVASVNLHGTPPDLSVYVSARSSAHYAIEGDDGDFDTFFERLWRALRVRPPREVENLFKYLEAYRPSEHREFLGRDALTERVLDTVRTVNPGLIILYGDPKVGKTSFVRAGVMANLDEKTYDVHYMRCRPDFEEQIVEELAPRYGMTAATATADEVFDHLESHAPKQLILIVDHVERALEPLFDGKKEEAERLFKMLAGAGGEKVTIILVCLACKEFWEVLAKAAPELSNYVQEEIQPLSGDQMAEIMSGLATRGHMSFEDDVLPDLQERYQKALESQTPRFTLAHVQSICHLMANTGALDRPAYNQVLRDHLEGLDLAINTYNIVSFVEDFPVQERVLLRKLMQIISNESKKALGVFFKEESWGLIRTIQASAERT